MISLKCGLIWCGVNLLMLTFSLVLRAKHRKTSLAKNLVVVSGSVLALGLFLGVTSAHEGVDEIDELLALSDDDLLESIQAQTFRYFWDFAHPVSGLIRERNTSGELVTSGGSGFGVMALLVGIERQFISREQGATRLQKIIDFLSETPTFKGAFPHWLNGTTGATIPFSPRDNGGDLVETALLMQGLLTARQFFDQDSEEEENIRLGITSLWEAVDWNWYRKQVQKELFWHWSPSEGFAINLPIRGWNETMIAYLLAVASPTHGVPSDLYKLGWAGGNYLNGSTHYGYKLDVGNGTGGPLFFAHYSFLGFDPRNLRDQYANYFFQGQNQTLINRAWCIENPGNFKDYGAEVWGLTASDDPEGYAAHAPNANSDNGTITPSAGISSIVYTPEESIALVRSLLSKYREKVWGTFGFYDAFNPSRNWFADSYLAIDQGPIICMIENYRSELLWKNFMKDPDIQRAIEAIGFVEDLSTTSSTDFLGESLEVAPNPFVDRVSIKWLDRAGPESFELMNAQGDVLYTEKIEHGSNSLDLILGSEMPAGIYFLSLKKNGKIDSKKLLHY